jgi:hypothetical protein
MSADLTEFHDFDTKDLLYSTVERLERQLKQAKDRGERMVAAAHQGAFDAMISSMRTPVPRPSRDRRTKHKPEIALWHMTDWQGAKLSVSYDSNVMRKRVLYFCDKASLITNIQRADHPVTEVALAFGGDMVEGLFQFPTQPFEIDQTIFGQYVTVSKLIIDVVRRALAVYDSVRVVAEWGNHGRIGSRRQSVPRSDNFDRMCYELARQLLAGEPRLSWDDCPEDIQQIELGNYRAILIHGDEIGRNGYASPNTIVAWVTRQQSGAYPWEFHDAYVGHYHQNQEWSLPGQGGRVFMTGSTESDNRYAGVMLAASAVPSQRLHFIDPDKGRVTAQHIIWLDEA